MTTRVTVSLPDDVAAQLADLPARQVSAYITEAVRRRTAGDAIRTALGMAGHGEYSYDLSASLARLSRPEIPAEMVADVRERWEAATGRTFPGQPE
ncbi:hypothetical protein ACWKSP_03875 [Micromonosporaceae bacterium Da 78-11]